MYFIEKLLRVFYSKRKKLLNYEAQDIDKCNHLFVPIDSSGEYLACTKCGKLVKNKYKKN